MLGLGCKINFEMVLKKKCFFLFRPALICLKCLKLNTFGSVVPLIVTTYNNMHNHLASSSGCSSQQQLEIRMQNVMMTHLPFKIKHRAQLPSSTTKRTIIFLVRKWMKRGVKKRSINEEMMMSCECAFEFCKPYIPISHVQCTIRP